MTLDLFLTSTMPLILNQSTLRISQPLTITIWSKPTLLDTISTMMLSKIHNNRNKGANPSMMKSPDQPTTNYFVFGKVLFLLKCLYLS